MGNAVRSATKKIKAITLRTVLKGLPIFTSVVRVFSAVTPISFLFNAAILAVQVIKPKALPIVGIVVEVATGNVERALEQVVSFAKAKATEAVHREVAKRVDPKIQAALGLMASINTPTLSSMDLNAGDYVLMQLESKTQNVSRFLIIVGEDKAANKLAELSEGIALTSELSHNINDLHGAFEDLKAVRGKAGSEVARSDSLGRDDLLSPEEQAEFAEIQEELTKIQKMGPEERSAYCEDVRSQLQVLDNAASEAANKVRTNKFAQSGGTSLTAQPHRTAAANKFAQSGGTSLTAQPNRAAVANKFAQTGTRATVSDLSRLNDNATPSDKKYSGNYSFKNLNPAELRCWQIGYDHGSRSDLDHFGDAFDIYAHRCHTTDDKAKAYGEGCALGQTGKTVEQLRIDESR